MKDTPLVEPIISKIDGGYSQDLLRLLNFLEGKGVLVVMKTEGIEDYLDEWNELEPY